MGPLPSPQHLNTLYREIEDEAAHISMVSRPLSVLCIGATGGWWWMEVCSRIVRVWMPISSLMSGFRQGQNVLLIILNALY